MKEWIFISQKFSDHYLISHTSDSHKLFNKDIYVSSVLPDVHDSFLQGFYF